MAAILNTISINKKLQNLATSKRYVGLMREAANTRLTFAKIELLEDFTNNEVVKEIVESSKNPSIEGSKIVSKGNLTSYLGLYPGQGELQINSLKEVIEDGIIMSKEPIVKLQNNKVLYSFKVKVPSNTTIESITPSGWTTKSWIDIVENGISNTLKKFIFWAEGFGKKSGSRSGTGLQTKGNVSNVAELTPTPFLTELFNKFRTKFNK